MTGTPLLQVRIEHRKICIWHISISYTSYGGRWHLYGFQANFYGLHRGSLSTTVIAVIVQSWNRVAVPEKKLYLVYIQSKGCMVALCKQANNPVWREVRIGTISIYTRYRQCSMQVLNVRLAWTSDNPQNKSVSWGHIAQHQGYCEVCKLSGPGATLIAPVFEGRQRLGASSVHLEQGLCVGISVCIVGSRAVDII